MGIMTTGAFADLHSKDFSKIFMQIFSAQIPIFSKFFNVDSSVRKYENFQE